MTLWWEDLGVVLPKRSDDLGEMLKEAGEKNKTTPGEIKAPPCGACRYFVPMIVISERAAEIGFKACMGPRQERDFSCYEARVVEL